MLIKQDKKALKKAVTFRVDSGLLDEFKHLCKKHDLKQVSIIENAMKKAIEEIKEMESNDNDSK